MDSFLSTFMHRTEVAHLEPTKVFPKLSPKTAMLSAYTPVPLLLLNQNLYPKDIAGSDMMKGSCQINSGKG